VSVVRLIVSDTVISGKIIKEMPDSAASGTHCISYKNSKHVHFVLLLWVRFLY
jgi:hypothetical protein